MEQVGDMQDSSRRNRDHWGRGFPRVTPRGHTVFRTTRENGRSMAEVTSGKDSGKIPYARRINYVKGYSAGSANVETPPEITFKVRAERLSSKPRMTQSDRWKKRPIVERWLAFKDLIALSYKQAGGRSYFGEVAIQYDFYLYKRRIDLDNLIKGVNDSLSGLAWVDDDVGHVRQYDGAFTHFVERGSMEEIVVRIRPLPSIAKREGTKNVV